LVFLTALLPFLLHQLLASQGKRYPSSLIFLTVLLPFLLHQLSASQGKLYPSSFVFLTVLFPFLLHQLSANQGKDIVDLKYLVGCVISRHVIKPSENRHTENLVDISGIL
jgi:uncharacterized protein YceK